MDKEITKALLKAKDWAKLKGVIVNIAYNYTPEGFGKLQIDFYADRETSEQVFRLFQKDNQSIPTSETEFLIIKM
jgi:hypothetical protein